MPLPRCLLDTEPTSFDLRSAEGEWPASLSGELVLAAPGPKEDLPYGLFGPGYVIRISLTAGTFGAPADRFAVRARRILSPSVRLFEADRASWRTGGTGYLSDYGLANMANTAVMPFGGRLFATWDVGRPVEIDPVSLEFLGEVGSADSWGSTFPMPGPLPFILSTAHPVVDPERDVLWSVKLTPSAKGGMQPSVVRYDGDGKSVSTWPVDGASFDGTMHTITQTREWLILADSGNFKMDPGELAGGPRTVLMDDASPVFLVRKETLERTRPGRAVAMTPFSIGPPVGHFYAQYDDADGIRILWEHMDGVDLGFYLKPDDLDVNGDRVDPALAGFYNMGMRPSSLSETHFDPLSGEADLIGRVESEHTFNNQLSAIDWSLEGLARPDVHHMIWTGYRPQAISQRALEAYGDRMPASLRPAEEQPCSLMTVERGSMSPTSTYHWPRLDDLATSPIFVPRGAGHGLDPYAGFHPGGRDGHVVVPVVSDDGFRLDCFDASRVGDGPVASLRAANGERLGSVLHSCWLPEAQPAPSLERLTFQDDLSPERLARLSDDQRHTVERVARELAANERGSEA